MREKLNGNELESLQEDREVVLELEAAMREFPQVELEVRHHFSPGIYARELHIPAGIMMTGKIHRHEVLNIVSQGRLSVYKNGRLEEIKGPCTFLSPAGTKRAGYVHEDTIWTTVHATDETDLEVLEEEIIAESFEALEADDRIFLDQAGYEKFAVEYNITDDFTNMLLRLDVQEVEVDGVELCKSELHGTGVFATRKFEMGEIIGPAILNGGSTNIGRYANHSEVPNARMIVNDKNDIDLVAVKDFDVGEITVNYREVMDSIKSLEGLA